MMALEEIGLKSVLVLLLVFALSLFLRKATAAKRHCLWAAGLFSLAALPFLVCLLPVHEIERPEPFASGSVTSVTPPTEQGPQTASDEASQAIDSPATPRTAPQELLSQSRKPEKLVPKEAVIVDLWAIGLLFCLVGTVLRLVRAGRIVRSASIVENPSISRILEKACVATGLSRQPRLLATTEAAVPMTIGVFRPVILLPSATEDWAETTLQSVLLHECAHIRRGDWALLVFGKVLCALYWPNPLVWLSERRMRAASEAATDDMVLLAGVDAPRYAEDLLNLASSVGSTKVPVHALAAVDSGMLKTRIKGVLAKSGHGGPLSWEVVWLVLVLGTALVSAVACTRFVSGPAVADGKYDLGKGHWVSLFAITEMNGETARTWNARGELLPEPLGVDQELRNQLAASSTTSSGGTHIRYLFFRADTHDAAIVCSVRGSDQRQAVLPYMVKVPPSVRRDLSSLVFDVRHSVESVDGGSLKVARVDFDSEQRGSVDVWAPSEEWQTYANAMFSGGRLASTSKRAFAPKVELSPYARHVGFDIPDDVSGEQLELRVEGTNERRTESYSPVAKGRQSVFLPAFVGEVERIELTHRHLQRVTVKDLPLAPNPGALYQPSELHVPGLRIAKGSVATLSDGSKMELIGVLAPSLQGGGWTIDGTRTKRISDPNSAWASRRIGREPPSPDGKRRILLSFGRPESQPFSNSAIFDETGISFDEGPGMQDFRSSAMGYEVKNLVVSKSRREATVILRAPSGHYHEVARASLVGKDRLPSRFVPIVGGHAFGGKLDEVFRITIPQAILSDLRYQDSSLTLLDRQRRSIRYGGATWGGPDGYCRLGLTRAEASRATTTVFRVRQREYVEFPRVRLWPK